MKTKLEILKETKDYYAEDVSRRATNGQGGCFYLTKDGRRCAFGRCCTEEDLLQIKDCENSIREDGTILQIPVDKLLKPEYQGHDCQFWINIQQFHDNKFNWNLSGLTHNGNKRYEQLLLKWGES